MIETVTFQVRVSDFDQGKKWYAEFLQKQPDFEPHQGFAEWELLPGCWLQVAEGEPAVGNGPLRVQTDSIEQERTRLLECGQVEDFTIYFREEVPVRWATFSDPWGNRLGLFEEIIHSG
ncbi:VOC family protein [Virgibacillus senegalensis]|uniref:VOC family protein n=1 Tax=Virgibacillus senegalensis TaxID=1499679 RepID=UPI00069FDE4A|nr:VOC family protein [Virgibacillus senegalensis]